MSAGTVEVGQIINQKYEIVGLVGQGAHGTVCKAVQHPVGRSVALKFISRHLSEDPDNRIRFFHEAKALARLNHPSVVTLYDYGEANDRLFMAMEFIEGEELTKVIEREGPMEPTRVVYLAKQMLSALIEAHEIGLVHRDLKPENVMVYRSGTGEERIKILDFGIATLREDRGRPSGLHGPRPLGTPGYCAPEQCLGRPVGPASDLYALGVILYEMLTGSLPFQAPSAWMLMERHLKDSVPTIKESLNVPPGLESMIRLALAKQPEARFPDARAMLTRLGELDECVAPIDAYAMPTLRDIEALDGSALAALAQHYESQARTVVMPTQAVLSDDINRQDAYSLHESSKDPATQLALADTKEIDLDDLVTACAVVQPSPSATASSSPIPPLWTTIVRRVLAVNTVLVVSIGFMLSVFSNYS